MSQVEHFADNVSRLFGLHKLTRSEIEKALPIKVSYSTLSKWEAGTRTPSFAKALEVGAFFGIAADRLATAEFEDLLAHELADPRRFQAVEVKIRAVRRGLRSVPPPLPRVRSIESGGEDTAMETVEMIGSDPAVSSPLHAKKDEEQAPKETV